jgi:glyoxylate/hydroxypyruvate reductase A
MTRSLALISQSLDLGFLRPILDRRAPGLQVSVWPDPACLAAEVAACWDAPAGVFSHMPNLRLVHSIGAGVDKLLGGLDPAMQALAVCRVVDPSINTGMFEYVLWGVLYFHRHFDRVLANQTQSLWQRPEQCPAQACRIGVMGMGELGGSVSARLSRLGYAVSGWSRRPTQIDGVQSHAGEAALEVFLGQSDIVVCLLPLTPKTHGLLNAQAFAALPRGAALIHCGRGEHLVAPDLVAALDSGHLRGAILDVFAQEPLPADNPLWRHPRVVVTPHMASLASFETVVQQVLDNIHRLDGGQALHNQVDLSSGY